MAMAGKPSPTPKRWTGHLPPPVPACGTSPGTAAPDFPRSDLVTAGTAPGRAGLAAFPPDGWPRSAQTENQNRSPEIPPSDG